MRIPCLVAAFIACCCAPNAFAQKVVVTYFSQTGHTKTMGEAVARGARSVPGAEVRLIEIGKTTVDDLKWADAIIVGSPVQNSNVPGEVQQAIVQWPFQGLRDKVGAAFTTGAWISGGQELVQMHLIAGLMEFGMIIVGGDAPTPFGAAAITADPAAPAPKGDGAVDAKFLARGEALGKRVAERAAWIVAGKPKPAAIGRSGLEQ